MFDQRICHQRTWRRCKPCFDARSGHRWSRDEKAITSDVTYMMRASASVCERDCVSRTFTTSVPDSLPHSVCDMSSKSGVGQERGGHAAMKRAPWDMHMKVILP